ncbi:MAG: hypothetical protein ACOYEM_08325 [Bacillota bacterium]|jgi:hypothetical protein
MRKFAQLTRRVAAVVAVSILAAASLPAIAVCNPALSRWSLDGDSTFKAYWQTTFRLSNTANLRLRGSLGPLNLEGTMRLLGASYGLSDGFIELGPWVEKIERWSVAGSMGALSMSVGDTFIPVLSGRYLVGKSLYGVVANAGGELAGVRSTFTVFKGVNAVSSGLAITSTEVAGGAVEAALGRTTGLTLQGLMAEREGVDLKMGGVQARFSLGRATVDVEGIVSHDDIADNTGWLGALGMSVPALKGMVTASGQYTSDNFTSLSLGSSDTAGGAYEVTATWSGPVSSWPAHGISVSGALVATASANNVTGEMESTSSGWSSEASLTFRGAAWLARAKYGLNSKQKLDGEELESKTVKRTATLEAAMPLQLGQSTISADIRLSRTTTHDQMDDSVEVDDAALARASTTLGKTYVALSAGASLYRDEEGALDGRTLDAALSLSRPLWRPELSGGLELTGTSKQKPASTTRTAEGAVWARYSPGYQLSVAVKAKGQLIWNGAGDGDPSKDAWLEAEVRLVF